jgi:hypothetical protein
MRTKKVTSVVISAVALLLIIIAVMAVSCNKDNETPKGKLEISSCFIGSAQLQPAVEATNIPLDQDIKITFNEPVDTTYAKLSIFVNDENNISMGIRFVFTDDNKTVLLEHSQNFSVSKKYFITITEDMKGNQGQTFEGVQYIFRTSGGVFTLNSIFIEGIDFTGTTAYYNVNRQGLQLALEFSEPVDSNQAASKFTLSGIQVFEVSYEDDFKKINLICQQELEGYKKYVFDISTSLKSAYGSAFLGFSNSFITEIDSTLKFPQISDEELLTLVQKQTFKFFYDYAHPACGMTRERLGSGDIVTSGGSGFGVMALIVGIERGFITRDEGISQLTKMIGFLETCDRFHGAWSHWINGSNGNVVPFSSKDNGGDLVETAYMAQGLLTMRQYLDPENTVENELIGRINELYNGIEWDWYRRNGQNVLYWHWSPNYGWDMNMQIRGYNETLITYIMAASSTTYTITPIVYQAGYARSGGIINGNAFYGYTLPVGYDYGGPLFFAHYSFLGLDPRNLSDAYANYWTQNVNHSLINWAYCADNPKGFPNYNEHCWGLTASDIPTGYAACEPTNDRGVIAPTAAVSSLPFTPEQSMNAIRHFYYLLGDHLWGEYGFRDAFDVHVGWWADSYISIDQGPQVVMIENYRTGLLWDLFMSAPEVQAGLEKLGFSWQK